MIIGTTRAIASLAALGLLLACAVPAAGDSFFMYQGRLKVGGVVPEQSSFFDVQFRLFDAPAGGILFIDTIAQVSVLDSNGLFRAMVDLGPNAFDSTPRWLELAVRRAGTSNEFAVLLPRQRIGPVPTSLHAQSADVATSLNGVVSFANLPSGIARLDAPQVFTAAPSFNSLSGAPFTVARTQQVANLNVDLLDGLDSTQFWRRTVSGNTEVIGPPSDTRALNLQLGADRALRLQPGDANLGSSLVGGSANNNIATGVPGAVIVGGRNNLVSSNAHYSVVAGGDSSQISVGAYGSAVGGGARQLIGPNSVYSGIFAGYAGLVSSNSRFAGVLLGNYGKVQESSDFSVVLSGDSNTVGPQATHAAILSGGANRIEPGANVSAIVSGQQNTIRSNAFLSSIVSGQQNAIDNGASRSFLGGGDNNEIGPQSYDSFLGGGNQNKVQFNAHHAALMGGQNNLVRSNAGWATVLGGANNVAGAPFSLAGGQQAKAEHSGSVVFADMSYADFTSSRANEFAVRARGGVRFETAGAGLTVDGMRLTGGGGNLVLAAGSVNTSNLVDGAVLGEITDDDGAGSGLDADRLDGLSSEDFWRLTGNAGTTAGLNFLGTTDDQPLHLRVNNQVALRLKPESLSPSLIGGSRWNDIPPGVVGAVICGGGTEDDGTGFARGNSVRGDFGSVVGGFFNRVQTNSHYSFIGGGHGNRTEENALWSVIAGGRWNSIEAGAGSGAIGGGVENHIGVNSGQSVIAGGTFNLVSSDTPYATIPGGRNAQARSYGQQAYSSGGFNATASGEAQASLYVLHGVTTNAIPQELFLDGQSRRIRVPKGGAWTYEIMLVATLADEVAVNGYQIRGVIKHTTGGATSLVGVPAHTVLAAEAPAWAVSVEADDANDALMIKVTGTTAKTIRWVATVRTAEVVF